ncbi:MAG: hypothetical protein E7652_05025 [Ruminococcaceae bacterium]|nr:hypothetical protein [Oscillospiraceae bacterium]
MDVSNKTKVLIILTDGMHPDALKGIEKAENFIRESASTLQGRSVMPSDTLPCHMSLFKSVPPELHKCKSNSYTKPDKDYRTICDVLSHRDLKCAMLYSWEQLRDINRPNDIAFSCYINEEMYGYKETVHKLTDKAIELLREDICDFIFLHYDLIDEMGHHNGWLSDEYIDAVEYIWDEIYKVLEHTDDNTTVFVLSDHCGHEHDHGDECDTLIPVMIKGKSFEKGSALKDVSIMDIAPTVAKLFGIPSDPEWNGKALF